MKKRSRPPTALTWMIGIPVLVLIAFVSIIACMVFHPACLLAFIPGLCLWIFWGSTSYDSYYSHRAWARYEKSNKTISEICEEAKEKPVPPTSETSMLFDFLELKTALKNTEIANSASRLYALAYDIQSYTTKNPNDKNLIREYFTYYLPTTINLLTKYFQFSRVKEPNDEILTAKTEIAQSVSDLLPVYQQSLQKLYQDDVLDVSADIKVLNTKLAEKKREADFVFPIPERS